MCDDLTKIEEDAALAAGAGVNRRDFAVMAGALTLAGCAGMPANGTAAALRESMVAVPTPDGTTDAFFVHPAKGKHPAVIMWPDVAGLRDAYKAMARRLAEAGYAVLVVNQYYRGAKAPIVTTMAEWRTPEGQAKIRPLAAALTPPGIASDARAFVAWLDQQAPVDTRRRIGTAGYCMTGSYTLRAAAALPARIGAACSFHGGGLVTDQPDSPHLLIPAIRAPLIIAIARNDDARAPGDKDALRAAATAAGRNAEIEVYPADHGWCTLDAPTYDAVQADRAWGRMLTKFAGL